MNNQKISYEKVYHYALQLFEFDKDKTNSWWMGKCEELDGLSPFEMVKEGRGIELMKIINKCTL